MTCPPNVTFFDFLENELEPSALNDFISHVSLCEKCHYKLQFLTRVKRTVMRIPETVAAKGTAACLTEDQISGFVDDLLEPAEREAVLGHALNCEKCLRRVLLVFEVLDHLQEETVPLPEEIWYQVREMGARQQVNQNRRPASHLISKLSFFIQSFFPFPNRPKFGQIAISVGAIFLILMLTYMPFSFFHAPDPADGFIIRALAPRNEIVSLLPEFRWQTVPQVEHFCVYLHCEKKHQTIWQQQTTGNCVHYPKDAAIKLGCNQSYSWYVEGTLASGEKIYSNTLHFSINPIFPNKNF